MISSGILPILVGSSQVALCGIGEEVGVFGMEFVNTTASPRVVTLSLYRQDLGAATDYPIELSAKQKLTWGSTVGLQPGDHLDVWASDVGVNLLWTVDREDGANPIASGFRVRGAWSNVTPYLANDVVSVGGSPYAAIENNTAYNPSTNPSKWMLLLDASSIAGAVTAVIDGAPSNLNTLNKLAGAIDNDPNFAATVEAALATKANVGDIPEVELPAPLAHVIGPNKKIIGPDGKPFTVVGTSMFDYLLASFDVRTDQSYRKIFEPVGTGPASGISEPTYYGRIEYISEAHVRAQVKKWRDHGGNLIRLMVEPACLKASVPYVDPEDGETYPADLVMLDTIVQACADYGVVAYISISNEQQFGTNNTAAPAIVELLQELSTRYADRTNVWLNPGNEINSTSITSSTGVVTTNPNVSNAANWVGKCSAYVAAIRSAGFKGLIGLCPPNYGYRLDLVSAGFTGNATLNNDGGVLIDVHHYATGVNASFYTSDLAGALTSWGNYISTFPIMVGEVGINNNLNGGLNLDPNLNGATTDAAMWARLQSWMKEFLEYCFHSSEEKLNGVVAHMWHGYVPGMSAYDNNTMTKNDGSLTTWGTIFRDHYAARPLGWRDWTPVAVPVSGAYTDVTATGRYRMTGKRVDVEVFLLSTNIGTGTGVPTMKPPVPNAKATMIPGVNAVSGYPTSWLVREPSSGVTAIWKFDGLTPMVNGVYFAFQGSYEAR